MDEDGKPVTIIDDDDYGDENDIEQSVGLYLFFAISKLFSCAQKITVPVTVSISVMLLFLVSGAAIFQVLEKNWTLMDGIYFCFVTATTIGKDCAPKRCSKMVHKQLLFQ